MSTFLQRCPRSTTGRTNPSYSPTVTRLLPALCAIAVLSGCTVPVVGSTGIGVDQEGRPVGYLAVCEENIDGATLYYDDPGASSAEDGTVDAGQWAADQSVTSASTWSLTEPHAGVKGHWFLPRGGRETCPVTVTRSARWWPWDLPSAGHHRPGAQVNGLTP